MKRSVGTCVIPLVCCLLLGATGCGKSNIFSWAHSAGSDSSPAALSSDAYTALQSKDYGKALEYYKKILENDPANSEAIYGAAAAELANAGLDIGELVANLVQQRQAPTARNLAPALAVAARTVPSAGNILPLAIIARLQILRPAVDNVLSNALLLRIVQGSADGRIAPNNPNVNLNIAFCLVVRAAIKACDAGIQINSDYTVSGSIDVPTANSIGKDIISAYHRLLVVNNTLHYGSDSAIANISEDVQKLFDDLKASNPGITVDLNQDYYLMGA